MFDEIKPRSRLATLARDFDADVVAAPGEPALDVLDPNAARVECGAPAGAVFVRALVDDDGTMSNEV
jgi:hypothetical protein